MTELICISLQRNDSKMPWGIELEERYNIRDPIIIRYIHPAAVAYRYLKSGDIILYINNVKSTEITNLCARQIFKSDLNEIKLTIKKNNKLDHNKNNSWNTFPYQNANESNSIKNIKQLFANYHFDQSFHDSSPKSFLFKPIILTESQNENRKYSETHMYSTASEYNKNTYTNYFINNASDRYNTYSSNISDKQTTSINSSFFNDKKLSLLSKYSTLFDNMNTLFDIEFDIKLNPPCFFSENLDTNTLFSENSREKQTSKLQNTIKRSDYIRSRRSDDYFDINAFKSQMIDNETYFTANKSKRKIKSELTNEQTFYNIQQKKVSNNKVYSSKDRQYFCNKSNQSQMTDSKSEESYNIINKPLFNLSNEEMNTASKFYSRQTSQNLSEAEQISPQSSCTSVPPPPPPPGPGTILSKRLSTEIPDRRVEPPACVQNAMMTKDKKPFTYTPGGLDLSQIRSPRMARRISRNAHAEGTSDAGPRPSPLASQAPPGPLPPAAVAAMQAQMPVQVFPTGPPPPPPPPSSTNNGNTGGLPPSIVSPPPMNNMASPPNYQRPEIKLPANPTGMLRSTQDTQKSTSPVMEQSQNQIYNEEESNQKNKPQLGSIYIPPINNQDTQINKPGSVQTPHIKSIQSPTIQKVNQSPTPLSPTPNLNKAPTPWLTNRPSPQTKVPSWVHREESQSPSIQNQGGARVIPIQIEGRPSVLQKRPEQIQSSSVQHMPMHQEQHFQQQQMKTKSEQQSTRIIPIQVEEASYSPGFDYSGHTNINTIQQQFNRQNSTNSQQGYQMKPQFQQQFSSQIPVEQMKKLQLAEEDRTLMNKFKNQVDEDIFLHNESDPRYKGAAIPSRAFRMLQTMTDSFSGPSPHYSTVPRGPGSSRIAQTRQMSQPHSDDGAGLQQPYIPPSEQTVTEPRKYTGAAIPSRSFRILQAMTAPENCGPGQSDL